MKKFILIFIIVSSLFSSNKIDLQNNIIHGHIHESINEAKHIHEHSHSENTLTLFYQFEFKDDFIIKLKEIYNNISLINLYVKQSIFKPPIS